MSHYDESNRLDRVEALHLMTKGSAWFSREQNVKGTIEPGKYADFAIAYTSRTNGQITISLTDAQTAGFPDSLRYDVLLQDGSGNREYYLEGVITVSQGYTRHDDGQRHNDEQHRYGY